MATLFARILTHTPLQSPDINPSTHTAKPINHQTTKRLSTTQLKQLEYNEFKKISSTLNKKQQLAWYKANIDCKFSLQTIQDNSIISTKHRRQNAASAELNAYKQAYKNRLLSEKQLLDTDIQVSVKLKRGFKDYIDDIIHAITAIFNDPTSSVDTLCDTLMKLRSKAKHSEYDTKIISNEVSDFIQKEINYLIGNKTQTV